MNRRTWAVMGILCAGNLLVWLDRLIIRPHPARFDLEGFERAARDIWRPTELTSIPFEPGRLIPATHLHLCAGKGELYSVYAGHYPRLGVLELGPHEPRVCYQRLGYEILRGSEVVHIDDGAARHALERIEIGGYDAFDDTERQMTVYYWCQYTGRMPDPTPGVPGPWRQTSTRFAEGRSDLVWVRVELRRTRRRLDDGLRRRLLALMRAAAAAMRVPPG